MATLNIRCKSFAELTPFELYDILQLRSAIFVVEQKCVFQDMDNKDKDCYHLMFYEDHLTGYARLVPFGLSYPDAASIGRVVVHSSKRRTGFGLALMSRAIQECDSIFGKQTIKIGAQLYAKKFYELTGFVQSGDMYDEDGIDHIEMTRL